MHSTYVHVLSTEPFLVLCFLFSYSLEKAANFVLCHSMIDRVCSLITIALSVQSDLVELL